MLLRPDHHFHERQFYKTHKYFVNQFQLDAFAISAAIDNIGDDPESNEQLNQLAEDLLVRVKENECLYNHYASEKLDDKPRPKLSLPGT